jgi:hypothetical protein
MYRLTNSDSVVRVADGAAIPADPRNADRIAFDAWVAAGGEPLPYEAPAAGVPQSVTKRQALQALILAGRDADVDSMLEAMPGVEGKLARAEWRESNSVERNRPLVQQLGAQLGLDAAALDALFTQAAQL